MIAVNIIIFLKNYCRYIRTIDKFDNIKYVYV